MSADHRLFQSRHQGELRPRLEGDEPRRSNGLVLDAARRRPRYFDGRFLSASDLLDEQGYFLDRQRALGRALGSGVVEGLEVQVLSSTRLAVTAGHGLTPAGELVSLRGRVEANVADLAGTETIKILGSFNRLPLLTTVGRSGLFALVLRPIEYTARPVTAYPTTVDGRRTVADGDLVEASHLSLLALPMNTSAREGVGLRARLAWEVFVQGTPPPGLPAGLLPLALLELERGVLRWLDPHLVRRSLSAQTVGMNGVRRGAVTQLVQYRAHLADVVAERRRGRQSVSFAATEHFRGLPAAGPLPVGSLDLERLSLDFLPAEFAVELSVVPEDEVPALVEEALTLPPLDLTLTARELAAVAVLVVAPVPRARLGAVLEELEASLPEGSGSAGGFSTTATTLADRSGAAALAPVYQEPIGINPAPPPTRVPLPDVGTPYKTLIALRLPTFETTAALPPAVLTAWRKVLGTAPQLWYLRRRNLVRSIDVLPVVEELREPGLEIPGWLENRLRGLEQMPLFRYVHGSIRADARPQLLDYLSQPYLDQRLPMEASLQYLHDMLEWDPQVLPTLNTLRSGFDAVENVRPIREIIASDPTFLASRQYYRSLGATGVVPQLLMIYARLFDDAPRLATYRDRVKHPLDIGAGSAGARQAILGALEEIEG